MDAIDYYDQNAEDFFFKTVNADMSSIYKLFLKYVPKGGCICDLGCGSGRDSKYFLEQGYKVIPVDGSINICRLASNFLGIKVENIKFQELNFISIFDAIWACSSLIFVSYEEMNYIINKILLSCKDMAIIYLCFKYGNNKVKRHGCEYYNYTEKSFNQLLKKYQCLSILEEWLSYDVLGRLSEPQWLNIILEYKSN